MYQMRPPQIMEPTIKIALVGAGMFGGDVHLRAYADLQRFGIAGQLARVGLDKFNRDLAPVKFDLVAVDMHKRYDPDPLRIRDDIQKRIGAPLYGTAYLEEPLEVSTSTFKWVESSDPFSYVGPHWTDLIFSYYKSKPVSLTAVGQKKRLVRDGINAYDAVQVRVDYANGMSINYHNNWITPADFEGPVNQGHEIVGTDGKVESDQQYRGLRWWNNGGGSRTANSHFTRSVRRADGSEAYVGYGVDSLTVGLAAICRMKFA